MKHFIIYSLKTLQLNENLNLNTLDYILKFGSFNKDFLNQYMVKIDKKIFLDKGLLLRPLGNVFYIMPPYCILKNELKYAYKIIYEGLKKI